MTGDAESRQSHVELAGAPAIGLAAELLDELAARGSTDALFLVDAEGRIVFANEAAATMFGHGPGELAGLLVDDLVPVPLRAWHAGQRQAYVAGPLPRPLDPPRRCLGRRKDGSEIALDMILGVVSAGDRRLALVFAKDVDKSLAAQARLHEYQEKLHAIASVATQETPLSPREREVLQLLAEGKTSKEVAATLDVAVSTVETHRRQIANKLGLHSIAELTKYAIRHGLTSVE